MRIGAVPGGEATDTVAGWDGQVVLVGEHIGVRVLVRLLLLPLLPDVDLGLQARGQRSDVGIGGHLFGVQHARLGHRALEADQQRLWCGAQRLANLLGSTPDHVQGEAVTARTMGLERTPEHLQQIAAVRPGRKARHVPLVQLNQADQRDRIGVREVWQAVLPFQLLEQDPFLVRRSRGRVAGPGLCEQLPPTADVRDPVAAPSPVRLGARWPRFVHGPEQRAAD